MLSISVIKQSGAKAAAYYTKEEKNYYLGENGDSNSQWFGKGAERNGILGKPVEQSELEMFLSGKTYDGFVQKSFGGALRPGWDFTLSAPKSVSILALVYGDQELIKAHDDAAKETIAQIEKDAAQVRIFDKTTGEMTFQNTGNVIAAMIRHSTSREMEPAMHTHTLISNISYDSNGKIRAMASSKEQGGDVVQGMAERVYRDQKYYTAIYQSSLAKKVEIIGYKVKSVGNGQFEIVGVPDKAISDLSTRRKQILAQASAFGVTTSKGMDVATQVTRKNKTFSTMAELKISWNLKHDTFDVSKIKNNNISENKIINISENAKKTIDLAVAHLGRFQTKITYEKVMETALGEFAIGEGIGYEECQKALESKLESNELIPLDKHKTVFTTKLLLDKEKNLVTVAGMKCNHLGIEVNQEAMNQLQLNSDNKNKLLTILESGKLGILIDIKGSTKQIIEGLIHTSENSGVLVKVLSPNRIEKNQLARVAQRQSSSLSQWIKNQFREDCHDTVHNFLNAEKNNKNNTNNKNSVFKNSLIIIDQANRLGVDEITGLFKKAHEIRAKLVFLNDEGKIKGYQFGNSIETLKQADILKLTWHNNQVSQASVSINAISNEKSRFQKVVDDYVRLTPLERLKAQVIALNRKEVFELNNQIRESLKSKGEIARIEKTFNNLTPVFLSEEEKQIIKNYQSGFILKVFDSKQVGSVDTFKIHNTLKNKVILKDDREKLNAVTFAELSKKQFMLFKEEKMSISMGDQILPLVDIKQSNIKAGDALFVKSIGFFGIKLQNQDGKTSIVSTNDLDGKSFQYNYAKSVNRASDNMDHTLLLTKSYSVNDKVLNTLLSKTNTKVDIYTNDEKQIKAKLAQNLVQPTAVNTVIDAALKIEKMEMFEKFVSEKTASSVRVDLRAALSKIKIFCNQTVVDKSVEFALSKITEKEAAFRHQDLVKEALMYALAEEGSPLNHTQIEEKLHVLKDSGFLLSADYQDGVRWTTKEILTMEKDILTMIKNGKNTMEPLIDKDYAKKALSESSLTPSQQEAVFLIGTTKDRFIAIQGLPGTGKSTMFSSVLSIVDEAKKISGNKIEFIGLAPTWQVVNELKDRGLPAQTLASFLQEIKSGVFDKQKYKNTVFLLDESSMVSNADKLMFGSALLLANARAVDAGDMEQVQGQGGGKPFELAIKRGVIEHVSMIDIIRQNPSSTLKRAVESIIDKDVKKSFDLVENQKGFESFGTKNTKKDTAKNSEKDAFLHDLNVKNIIETYANDHREEKINKEKAKEAMVNDGVKEYLERTPESRANSVFILHSNRQRDEFNAAVRVGLKEEKIINKDTEIKVRRLRPLNLTRAQMRAIDSYIIKPDPRFENDLKYQGKMKKSKLILSIGKNKYFEVASVDKESKLVTIVNVKTKEAKIFNPSKHNHYNTCLWRKSKQELAEGDLIVLRKADQDRNHIANIEFSVTHTNNALKTVTLKNSNETLVLRTRQMKDCHWDYAYSKTTDMAQGTTKKFVVFMVAAESLLTNIRRAIVDMSRATSHAMFITDKKEALIKRLEGKTLISVATNHGNKRSSLDTIEKILHEPSQYFDVKKNENENKNKEIIQPQSAQNIANSAQEKIDFNRIVSAQSIYNGTKDINGTLGERYLNETRKISKDTITRSEVRFWEKGVNWKNTDEKGDLIDQKNKINALVIPAIDKDGNITGVQRVYLDNNKPEKNTFMQNPKLSKGIVSGSPGLIQNGSSGRMFIAEGPETALSIAQVQPNATVLCAFSVSNFKKMIDAIKSYEPSEVIIAADNDGVNSNSHKETELARNFLESKIQVPVVTIYPDNLLNKAKTDFNDVLALKGEKALSEIINQGLKIDTEIKAGIQEKYRNAINAGGHLTKVSHLARIIDHAQSSLKLDSQKYNELASIINSHGDAGRIIDNVQSLMRNQPAPNKQASQARVDIELEI